MFILFCFAVHYAPGPSLVRVRQGMDGNIHFQFQGQVSLFSEESTPECNTFISGGVKRTISIIMMTAVFEGENCTILRKPDFLFEDAALDADQQLLVGEGQWLYTLDRDGYYLLRARVTIP